MLVKPIMNKLLTRKWDEKMQIEHRERVNNTQTRLNMKPPPSFRHLEFKPKTILNQEGKFDQCRKYIHKIIVFKCIYLFYLQNVSLKLKKVTEF